MIVASHLCLTEAANIFTIQYENRYYMYCEVKLLSRVRPFATPWTVAYQAPPSMGFSRQEYWSGLPFPSPEDLPDPGIEPTSSALASRFFTTSTTWEAL